MNVLLLYWNLAKFDFRCERKQGSELWIVYWKGSKIKALRYYKIKVLEKDFMWSFFSILRNWSLRNITYYFWVQAHDYLCTYIHIHNHASFYYKLYFMKINGINPKNRRYLVIPNIIWPLVLTALGTTPFQLQTTYWWVCL